MLDCKCNTQNSLLLGIPVFIVIQTYTSNTFSGVVPTIFVDRYPGLEESFCFHFWHRQVLLYSYFFCTKLHGVKSSSHPRGKGNFTAFSNHEVAGIVHMLVTLAVSEDDS